MALGRLLSVGILLLGVAVAALAQSDDAYDEVQEAAVTMEPYCECVPFYLCDVNNMIKTDGGGIFDVRQRLGIKPVYNVGDSECPMVEDNLMRCCNIPLDQTDLPGRTSTPEMVNTYTPASGKSLCGVKGPSAAVGPQTGTVVRIHGGNDLSSGEIPWMLVLLTKTDFEQHHTFRCGASLIHPQVALTAAHCFHKDLDVTHYVVRAGEYDTTGPVEPLPHQDRLVNEIAIPTNFNPSTLYHDIALVRLAEPLMLAEHIAPICLPGKDDLFDGAGCMVSGWGRTTPGGLHSTVLRQVDLNVVDSAACQMKLRTTRLGRRFRLDPSFICALGDDNEDTCEGDGGGPLVCPLLTDPTRWVQTGITAWGIGCADDVPGVYASVAKGRLWIDQQLLRWRFDLDDLAPAEDEQDPLDATIQDVFAKIK